MASLPLHFSSQKLSQYAQSVAYQRLVWPLLDQKKITVYLRRDDLASDRYPGNKFYKLFYNLQALLSGGVSAERAHTVVSFGGAYSNHIHALAQMGQAYHLATVGIIRGHRPQTLSPTLQDAESCGMRLLFLDRQHYKNKDLSPLVADLAEYGDYYLLPEGGENLEGVKGCRAIGEAIAQSFAGDYTVCTAVGTGTTLAGIIAGLPENQSCLGFSVLKGEDQLSPKVEYWLNQLDLNPQGQKRQAWRIVTGHHHGGYAKTSPELLQFMATLEADNQLLLEPVYSAKMLWGIEQLALADYWPEGSTIVAVHGGGLQGRRGFSL